jgi:hypothetical protein
MEAPTNSHHRCSSTAAATKQFDEVDQGDMLVDQGDMLVT